MVFRSGLNLLILFSTVSLTRFNAYAAQECETKGSTLSSIDEQINTVDGARTGMFFRETVAPNDFRKISSCFVVPDIPEKVLVASFGKKTKTDMGEQVPYAYFGVKIGKEDFEAGLYLDTSSAQPVYKLFSAHFDEQRMKYYPDLSFTAKDRVCMGLEYDRFMHKLNFTVVARESKLKNHTLSKDFADSVAVPSTKETTIQFKRVTSIATRNPTHGINKGSNNGLGRARVEKMIQSGISWQGEWRRSYLIGYSGKIVKLTKDAYVYQKSKEGYCTQTSLWPSFAVKANPERDGVTVQFLNNIRSNPL